MTGSSGRTARTSHTVGWIPSTASNAAAPLAGSSILPTASRQTSRSPASAAVLAEAPAEDRRIQEPTGRRAAHGRPGCRGRRLLLSDAHVEKAPWPAGTEGPEPSRPGHGGGNGHHPRVLLPDVDHGLAE